MSDRYDRHRHVDPFKVPVDMRALHAKMDAALSAVIDYITQAPGRSITLEELHDVALSSGIGLYEYKAFLRLITDNGNIVHERTPGRWRVRLSLDSVTLPGRKVITNLIGRLGASAIDYQDVARWGLEAKAVTDINNAVKEALSAGVSMGEVSRIIERTFRPDVAQVIADRLMPHYRKAVQGEDLIEISALRRDLITKVREAGEDGILPSRLPAAFNKKHHPADLKREWQKLVAEGAFVLKYGSTTRGGRPGMRLYYVERQEQ